jgi:hypothetical protein
MSPVRDPPDPQNRKSNWQPPPEIQEQWMGARALGALGGRTARLLAVAVLVTMVVAMLPPVSGAASSATDAQPVRVIVQARPGGLGTAARQVQDLGGRVGRQLQVINGFSAVVPPGAVGRLRGRRRSGR